jgi:hypothetical protein
MDNIRRLSGNIYSLRVLHKGCATLEHAIAEQKTHRWEPYVPTHFIYSFVSFNTLYNVDWSDSLNRGYVRSQHYTATEHSKIDAYIDFCCQDEEFLQTYKDFFVDYIVAHYDVDDILRRLKFIQVDRRYSNGSIWNQELIDKFYNACEECLKGQQFNKDIIKIIIDFVYKVRCNLFHGIKSMDELNDPYQQVRLDIYSLFTIAINQMVFSYIDYLNKKDIINDFDNLIEDLKWSCRK